MRATRAEGEQSRLREDAEEFFIALPAHVVGEILDGELVASPRPASPHSAASFALAMELGGPFQRGRGGPGGWWFFTEPELHFGQRPDKLVPDLAGWRRERLPDALGGDEAPAHYELAPDWVCEVLSKSTQRIDKIQKMRIYAREGVRNVWHVDPIAQTLDIFRLQGSHWLLVDSVAGDERVRAEPFEAIELDIAALLGQ